MRAASSSPQRQQLHCNTRIIHFTALTSHRKDHITRILTNYTSLARRSSDAYTAKSPQRPPPHRRPTDGLATSQTDSHDNLADHVTCAKKEDGRAGGRRTQQRKISHREIVLFRRRTAALLLPFAYAHSLAAVPSTRATPKCNVILHMDSTGAILPPITMFFW